MLEDQLKERIAEVPDFPQKGISFKDITPVLGDPELSRHVTQALATHAHNLKADFIAGIDARGFLFGMAVAQQTGLGFIPFRKKGKLPREILEVTYDLEYGSASIAAHREDIPAGARVLIHDDLLATGGTAAAAAKLIQQAGALVCGFQFLIELDFLQGRQKLPGDVPILSLCHY